jgi:oligopeptide transport system substrate-binding protein
MTPMLKNNLGVDVSIQQTDLANYWKLLNDPERPYQIFAFAWIADYADPQNFLEILFHSGSNQNWSNYSNAAVDQLLDQAGLEKDTVRRFKLYQQAEQMILADFPIVPLAYGQDYWLTKPYVKGMLYPPLVIPKLKYVSIIK